MGMDDFSSCKRDDDQMSMVKGTECNGWGGMIFVDSSMMMVRCQW